MISAIPGVDHAVATGYLYFQDKMSPDNPIAKPNAQNQELICAVFAPKDCAPWITNTAETLIPIRKVIKPAKTAGIEKS